MQKILAMFKYQSATSWAEGTPFLSLTAVSNTLLNLIPMGDDQKLSISGGLVEIAALTALIGGSTAESLALGSRGACGLPWAALSSFGSLFIVKACVSVCTPAWLRETIGVRTAGSDTAVGCNGRLDGKVNGRRMGGDAIGIKVECNRNKETSTSLNINWDVFEDVYAFDEWTTGPLRSSTALDIGEPLRAHFYMRDPQWAPLHRSQIKADWLSTLLTLAKVVEIYLLYHYGSFRIFWITGATWAYFLLSAIILQLFNLGRASRFGNQNKCIDIVAGKLPTPQVIGGERKVLFEVPLNPRKHRLWQAFWILGSVICVCSLVGTYALLPKEPAVCFHIWLTFQILWLSLRSIFFHFARQTDDMKRIITPAITEKHQPTHLNCRLLALSVAVSRYQVLNHPRGAYCYTEDAHEPTIIKNHLDESQLDILDHFQLPHQTTIGSVVEVSVAAVIGDTLLSSVAWLMGSPLTGMYLYDSCILVLRSSEKTLLVPACRVLAGRVDLDQDVDPELTMPSTFLPKGVSNSGADISWWYWIPCGGNTWMSYHTPWATPTKQSLRITGKREMAVISAENITEQLRRGELLVSLSSVKDVEDVVAQSAVAASILRKMMLGDSGY
ncbi:hypothetical protein DM02DRAFT_670802 [Periconia macrospinosa]|uniref:Uncharacterized protein n=1 Tax=Periconia macrospinosa TaxID=97972 RepID=A0A2V1DUV8_9PLEO|nr:hypothetical protein DM02DRAFT_670802 [Periconia macrospinosa]